jgi:hypothetical protein
MNAQELHAVRELVYIAKEIAFAMATNPYTAVNRVAGSAFNKDDDLARLFRAIDATGPLVYPHWDNGLIQEVKPTID